MRDVSYQAASILSHQGNLVIGKYCDDKHLDGDSRKKGNSSIFHSKCKLTLRYLFINASNDVDHWFWIKTNRSKLKTWITSDRNSAFVVWQTSALKSFEIVERSDWFDRHSSCDNFEVWLLASQFQIPHRSSL